jgi:ketosteroid isomerase-like protein
MSQENVEIVRKGIQAFNRQDLKQALSLWSPDGEIDWSQSPGPLRGVYRGQYELGIFWEEFWSTFEAVEVKTHRLMPNGADVVVPNTARLRGRDGIEVVARSTFVYTVEGGKISRLRMFQEQADALEAAGLAKKGATGSGKTPVARQRTHRSY